MKKILSILLMLAMITLMFASCANTPAENSVNEENTSADVSSADVTADDKSEDTDAPAASDLEYIQNKGKLIIGITDYAPMNYMDENGEWTGFDTEFALAVAEKLGVEAEFIEIEWDNKIFELDSKAIDCVWNGMTLTDEVMKSMNCTKPYVVNAQVVVMDKDKVADYKTVESLEGLTFAAEAGSAGMAAITDAGYEAVEVDLQSTALMEVASGAEDACVIDITMANAMTGEGTSYANLAYGLALTSEDYGIGFRKDSDVTEKVNEIIDDLKADGTLPALAEKYGLTLAE